MPITPRLSDEMQIVYIGLLAMKIHVKAHLQAIQLVIYHCPKGIVNDSIFVCETGSSINLHVLIASAPTRNKCMNWSKIKFHLVSGFLRSRASTNRPSTVPSKSAFLCFRYFREILMCVLLYVII